MLLKGKHILIMGLLDTRSVAWAIGQKAAEQGADVTYTVQNERFRDVLLRRSFKSEGLNVDDYRIIPCDITNDEEIKSLFDQVEAVDGLVHSIGYANPATCLANALSDAPRADVLQAFEISAASLAFVTAGAGEKLRTGASVVALSFDSQKTYPHYNWMGVCKAALEATARYLARDLGPRGIRVNSLSAGPMRTMAASKIPAFGIMEGAWPDRSPLGWDSVADRDAVADTALWMLSDLSRKVTGEVIYVDGGFHSVAVAASE